MMALLVERFAAGLGQTPTEVAAHAALLERLITVAQGEWPEVQLAPEVFAEHLGARLKGTKDLVHALDNVHASELWLACACGQGERNALRALEQRYLPVAARAVARFGDPHGFVADAVQELRERMLVGKPPRIEMYTGIGSLEAWIRVAAVRIAINLRKKRNATVGATMTGDTGELAGARDPELEFMKAKYRGDFTAALREALADLTQEDRTMLRFYLIDLLNIAEIGELFGKSRATIGRRIQDARTKVFDGTRRRLKERLRVDGSELDSLIAILYSQVNLSLSRVLGGGRQEESVPGTEV
jgi:RNA polymerase sigma-70 factor (ECF subfamily)